MKLKTVSLYKNPLPYIALIHNLALFYPTPCMPSPYSIQPHACPPPVLSIHCMPALPLFYPTPHMLAPYSIPSHAHSPPILPHPMHTLYSIPAHALVHDINSRNLPNGVIGRDYASHSSSESSKSLDFKSN